MLGPFAKCEPPLHCQSPGVASRTPAIAIAQAECDVHNDDNDDDNDNTWQRGPLWPHGMGPMNHKNANYCKRLLELKNDTTARPRKSGAKRSQVSDERWLNCDAVGSGPI